VGLFTRGAHARLAGAAAVDAERAANGATVRTAVRSMSRRVDSRRREEGRKGGWVRLCVVGRFTRTNTGRQQNRTVRHGPVRPSLTKSWLTDHRPPELSSSSSQLQPSSSSCTSSQHSAPSPLACPLLSEMRRASGESSSRLSSRCSSWDVYGPSRAQASQPSVSTEYPRCVSAAVCTKDRVLTERTQDLPPLLRLTTLHQFLSASGDLLLLALAAFISLSSLSSTTFCEALATSELSSSFDIFGWTVEACEEQSSSLVLSVLGFVAAITLVRAWAAFQMLSYYSAITKRAKRKGLSINTRDRYLGDNGSARGDAVSPGGGSSAGGGGNSGKRGGGGGAGGARIFLLPRPMDGSLQASDIPLLSLTPSSPGYVSFPPAPSYQPSAVGGSSEQQFLVYAPVRLLPHPTPRELTRYTFAGLDDGRTSSTITSEGSQILTPKIPLPHRPLSPLRPSLCDLAHRTLAGIPVDGEWGGGCFEREGQVGLRTFFCGYM
jgi:hypothetical protein